MLPLVSSATPERGDAARNRRLLLDAAALLVAERGVDAVTMDAVAAAAGVGKGTVFRRFGSRAGLMLALLDHSEQEFQAAFMSGPPPLGPGADPVERLVAFGRARLDMIESHGDIQRAAEGTGTRRYATPPYLVAITHVSNLLRESGHPEHTRPRADALLGMIAAELVLHQLRVLRIPPAALAENWESMVRAVCAPHS